MMMMMMMILTLVVCILLCVLDQVQVQVQDFRLTQNCLNSCLVFYFNNCYMFRSYDHLPPEDGHTTETCRGY
jgi:hypothetical protein